MLLTHEAGVVKAKPPSPPPIPRPIYRERERERGRETDIDISLSKNRTEVEIYRSSSRSRSRPRHRDNELVVQDTRRRRAHSAAPVYSPTEEEGEYITRKIDSRGYPGEAWHGATRNWGIIDVPPGTERVRMDGAGGGATDTQWTKYSGVRRTQFIPERDEAPRPAPQEPPRERQRGRNRGDVDVDVDVDVWDRDRRLEVDVDIDIDRRVDRRYTRPPAPPPPPAPPSKEMWTEISKDLVVKEAIEEMGYEYEDTPMFLYVMKYLRYVSALHTHTLQGRRNQMLTDTAGGRSQTGRTVRRDQTIPQGPRARDSVGDGLAGRLGEAAPSPNPPPGRAVGRGALEGT